MNLKNGSLLIILLILFGCDSTRIHEENEDIKNRIWISNQPKSFDFKISETQIPYNIYINVRNTTNYPHYNIYLSYQLKDSLNRVLEEDLVNFNLFDPKSGAPLGQSSLGDIFDHQFSILQDYSFNSPGRKILEIQQFMRYDSLPEIVSTGVRIEKSLPVNSN